MLQVTVPQVAADAAVQHAFVPYPCTVSWQRHGIQACCRIYVVLTVGSQTLARWCFVSDGSPRSPNTVLVVGGVHKHSEAHSSCSRMLIWSIMFRYASHAQVVCLRLYCMTLLFVYVAPNSCWCIEPTVRVVAEHDI